MDTTDLYTAFTDMFTTDPINWVKWGIMLAIMVLLYIPTWKIYGKVKYATSWERKADMARAKGQVLQGRMVDQRHRYSYDAQDRRKDWYYGDYEYFVDGQPRIYKAMFTGGPPSTLTLYYNRPGKLFSLSEYHWENHKGCLYGIILLLPIFIAAQAGALMGIPGLAGKWIF